MLGRKDKPAVTYKACNKEGHSDTKCWTTYPEKMPQWICDRIAAKGTGNPKRPDAKPSNKKPRPSIVDGMTPCPDQALLYANPPHQSEDHRPARRQEMVCVAQAKVIPNDEEKRRGKASEPCRQELENLNARRSKSLGSNILLDSGANSCIFRDREHFTTLKKEDSFTNTAADSGSMRIQPCYIPSSMS